MGKYVYAHIYIEHKKTLIERLFKSKTFQVRGKIYTGIGEETNEVVFHQGHNFLRIDNPCIREYEELRDDKFGKFSKKDETKDFEVYVDGWFDNKFNWY